VKWKYKVKAYSLCATPAGNALFIGGEDNALHAIDARTGKPKWKFATNSAVFTTPAVAGGLVFAASDKGTIYAVDAETGKQRWQHKVGMAITSSPAVSDGRVYFGAGGDDEKGKVVAFSMSGKKLWEYVTPSGVMGASALSDGVLYVGTCAEHQSHVIAIDAASGKLKWQKVAPLPPKKSYVVFMTAPAVSGQSVYFLSGEDVIGPHASPSQLLSYDRRSGKLNWKALCATCFATPTVLGDRVIVPGGLKSGNLLRAYDARTGKMTWLGKGLGKAMLSATAAGGTLYIPSDSGTLHAIDAADGTAKWSFRFPKECCPPVIGNGVIYVSCTDGHLYCLEKDPEQDVF
jgi:outer membrane protein assembly factor BamB